MNIYVAGELKRSFGFKSKDVEKMREISDYIQKRVSEIRVAPSNGSNQSSSSAADEILKLKRLLDMELITQNEFEEQKRKLLNS